MRPLIGFMVLTTSMASCGNSTEEALRALEIGDTDRAREIAEKIVRQSPEDVRARELLFRAYEEAGEWQSAASNARVLARLDPNNPAATFRLGFAQAMAGDAAAAQQTLTDWPTTAVRQLLLDSVTATGEFSGPSDSGVYDRLVELFREDSSAFRCIGRDIGAPYYFGARVSSEAAAVQHGSNVYSSAETVAGYYTELRRLSPDVASRLRSVVIGVLRDLAEPDEPSGTPSVAAQVSFFISTDRFHRAAGRLEQSLGNFREALRHYEDADLAVDFLNRLLSVPNDRISVGMHYKLSLYREFGEHDLLRVECAELRSRKSAAFLANPPYACRNVH